MLFYNYNYFDIIAGSSHSDKEVDPNTPEKIPRTPSERKRKRKADDGGGGVTGGPVGSKGSRSVAALENKKINEYFPKHHLGNSPIRHGGAKSPSPQQGYPMVNIKSVYIYIYICKHKNYLSYICIYIYMTKYLISIIFITFFLKYLF